MRRIRKKTRGMRRRRVKGGGGRREGGGRGEGSGRTGGEMGAKKAKSKRKWNFSI